MYGRNPINRQNLKKIRNSMKNILSILSKMALKILILEKTIFPAPQEQLRVLSLKEEKLMRILELA